MCDEEIRCSAVHEYQRVARNTFDLNFSPWPFDSSRYGFEVSDNLLIIIAGDSNFVCLTEKAVVVNRNRVVARWKPQSGIARIHRLSIDPSVDLFARYTCKYLARRFC